MTHVHNVLCAVCVLTFLCLVLIAAQHGMRSHEATLKQAVTMMTR